jgi:anti-anti-sigma factor
VKFIGLLTEFPVLLPYAGTVLTKPESNMQVIASAEKFDNVVVVTLRERLDVFSAEQLMEEFDALLAEGAIHFIVDLTHVRVVDADGDYPLLHLLKCAQEGGGSVSLVCPAGNPIRVYYEMMRLDTLFDMRETLEIALAQHQQT